MWAAGFALTEVTAEVDTRVGLVAHVFPYDEVIYLVRGQRVNELLDHEYVIVLDLSHFPDVREGEEVDMIFPEPHSPLLTWSPATVTLREGAGPGRRDAELVQHREERK